MYRETFFSEPPLTMLRDLFTILWNEDDGNDTFARKQTAFVT